MAALYGTIWAAMLLFAAGESGRSFTPRGSPPPRWAWWLFAGGLVLAIGHTLIAFAVVHHWSHADAVIATARQTREIYGVAFGAGLYVNYVFLGVWLADAWWWRAAASGRRRPTAVVRALRIFYVIIIFNATVVAAAGYRRALGVLLVSWLARVWSTGVSPSLRDAQPSSS
jgi:hypothetical protein